MTVKTCFVTNPLLVIMKKTQNEIPILKKALQDVSTKQGSC